MRERLVVVRAGKEVSSVCEPLPPDRPLWFPGSSPPEWLDGSLPGDFGFDPLGLGTYTRNLSHSTHKTLTKCFID